jgi:hypothetical protein
MMSRGRTFVFRFPCARQVRAADDDAGTLQALRTAGHTGCSLLHGLAERWDGVREVREGLLCSGELHYQVAVAGDVECWHRHFGPHEGGHDQASMTRSPVAPITRHCGLTTDGIGPAAARRRPGW